MARRKYSSGFLLLSPKTPLKLKSWSVLIFLLFSLAYLLSQIKQIQIYFSEAVGRNAQLVIPVHHTQRSPMRPIWQGVSQGLEEDESMLSPVISQGKDLNLQLVRIDHLFDNFIEIKNTNPLEVDFSKLDRLVTDILSMEAAPMFALSYTPPQLSADGSIERQPSDWGLWRQLITQTINRYSGTSNFNLNNIYYEVWNEPDLFGDWNPDREPRNYLTLYQQTAKAALSAENVNNFYLGGPATTGMYPNWIKALMELSQEQNIPLDFISWHRYSSDLSMYNQDITWVKNWLQEEYPNQAEQLQLIISEWGYSSELDPGNDTSVSAAHTVAVISQLSNQVDWLLPFELVDGLDPSGSRYWGRWGMITHPQISDRFGTGPMVKPRYRAFQLLNQLQGDQAVVLGEGSWVKALATISDLRNQVQVIIVNYDPYSRHQEATPLDILGLLPGEYQIDIRYLNGRTESFTTTIQGAYRHVFNLQPNQVVLLEISSI